MNEQAGNMILTLAERDRMIGQYALLCSQLQTENYRLQMELSKVVEQLNSLQTPGEDVKTAQ